MEKSTAASLTAYMVVARLDSRAAFFLFLFCIVAAHECRFLAIPRPRSLSIQPCRGGRPQRLIKTEKLSKVASDIEHIRNGDLEIGTGELHIAHVISPSSLSKE